jgi:hypothetical protein
VCLTRIKTNIFYILGVFDLNQNKYILYFRWRRQYLSIALIPKNVIDLYIAYKISRQGNFVDEFGVWVNGKDNNPEEISNLGFFHFSPPIKRPLNLPFADALLSINARACLS